MNASKRLNDIVYFNAKFDTGTELDDSIYWSIKSYEDYLIVRLVYESSNIAQGFWELEIGYRTYQISSWKNVDDLLKDLWESENE